MGIKSYIITQLYHATLPRHPCPRLRHSRAGGNPVGMKSMLCLVIPAKAVISRDLSNKPFLLTFAYKSKTK